MILFCPAISSSSFFHVASGLNADGARIVTRGDEGGLSMVVFESEEAAKTVSERIPSMITDAVTLEGVEVREVVAHA